MDSARFERLTQGFENIFLEFGQFIKEKYAAMREAYLSRFRIRATAHNRYSGSSVVRRPEWTLAHQSAGAKSRRAINFCHFNRFFERKLRQDSKHRLTQETFPHPARSRHQKIVSTAGRDCNGALCVLLIFNFRKIRRGYFFRNKILRWPPLAASPLFAEI